jgi:hypothetical protein
MKKNNEKTRFFVFRYLRNRNIYTIFLTICKNITLDNHIFIIRQ